MTTELVLWDWNGTLLDDLDFCIDCLNDLLREFGYPQRYDRASYREIFGFPIEDYYARVGFDFKKHPFPLLAERYMARYLAGSSACGVTPGARETLDALHRRGLRQVILSASPITTLRAQVAERGLTDSFTDLLGLGDIYAVSKVQRGLSWLRESGLAPARAVMIGDTLHDAEVAQALGVRCILTATGHQSRAQLLRAGCPVVSSLLEIPNLL